MRREGSPMKVKDYFTNPIHKIKQSSFLEVGFTHEHLNTFVKAFTNRFNSRYISFATIREFISTFTNNSPTLTKTYEQFFLNNFTITEYEDILLEDLVAFFTKDQGKDLDTLSMGTKRRIFAQLGTMNAENLVERYQELGVSMEEKQAAKMIRLLNWNSKVPNKEKLKQEAFLDALNNRSPKKQL